MANTSHSRLALTIYFVLQLMTVGFAQSRLPRSDRGSSPEAPSAVLYSNGPFISHPGQGFGGADASRVQNLSLGMSTFAFNASAGAYHLADQFTVPAGTSWYIKSVTVYAYQLGSPTTSPFTIGR